MNSTNSKISKLGKIAAIMLLTFLAGIINIAHASRLFPADVMRGEIEFNNMPMVLLNGKQVRLAPGVHIRDEHNRIPLSSKIRGGKFKVNYLRDPVGNIHRIWLLTEREIAMPVKRQDAKLSGTSNSNIFNRKDLSNESEQSDNQQNLNILHGN